jgi:3-methyladenine DNA glycosylase AlkC
LEPFKNLLGEAAAKSIARALKRADASFDSQAFLKNISKELEPLELKQRMVFLKARLHQVLPSDPKKSFPILVKALKRDDQDELGLSGFQVWPLTRYVAEYGLDSFDLAMKSLQTMTKVFTAEFDIRPFLIHHEDKTLKLLNQWTENPSEHVRRLVSEGTRPLLPWGERLPSFVAKPEKTWHLLEKLKNDPALYVRKSVANHINDHSKNHGDWVVKRLNAWKAEAKRDKDVAWIIRHSTRTLVKKCHKGALELHGIKASPVEIVQTKILNSRIEIGETLRIQIKLLNPSLKDASVILDQELLLLKSNGKHQAKVFKGKKLTLKPKEALSFELLLPIRPVTVRKYYTGKHYWIALLNGAKQKQLEFWLKAS